MTYSEILLDHFRSPRNAGPMRDADATGFSEDGACGDQARFYLRVIDGRVTEVRFQTYGCGPSIAASSVATEMIQGRSVSSLADLTASDVEAALGGLPVDRRHAASLVAEALRAAWEDYQRA